MKTISNKQLQAVSKMIAGRSCRANRNVVEVRGTSVFAKIDQIMNDLEHISKRIGIQLVYVDPAIYDATA